MPNGLTPLHIDATASRSRPPERTLSTRCGRPHAAAAAEAKRREGRSRRSPTRRLTRGKIRSQAVERQDTTLSGRCGWPSRTSQVPRKAVVADTCGTQQSADLKWKIRPFFIRRVKTIQGTSLKGGVINMPHISLVTYPQFQKTGLSDLSLNRFTGLQGCFHIQSNYLIKLQFKFRDAIFSPGPN